MRRKSHIKKIISFAMIVAVVGMFTWAGAQVVRPIGSDRIERSDSQMARSLTYLMTERYSGFELAAGTYVGSEFCLACHAGKNPESAHWRETKHAFFIRKPMGMYSLVPGKGVMANSLGNQTQDDFMVGLDFNTKTGTPFDSLKPNAPILSYDKATDKYYVQLGPNGLKLLVTSTQAGQSVGNGQRYHVRIPVSDTATGWSAAVYFAPVVWGGTGWSSNASNWYSGSTPKYVPGGKSSDLVPLQGQNYLATCSGCHITGVRNAYVTTAGEKVVTLYPAVLVPENSPNYPDLNGDGTPDLANIGCENCHGPGSAHILGAGDPAKIVNPSKITNNQQRSEVCLQCHVQIASAPTGAWGFTYDEKNNKPFVMTNPPDSLDNYQIFTGGKWPDGVNYVAARVDSFKASQHYQGSHGIACNDCHNAHTETDNDFQVRDKITRGTVSDIPADVDNDSFCLACHAGYGSFAPLTKPMIKDWATNLVTIKGVIEGHTHHPYGADRTLGLSRCITCHMGPTAGHGTIDGVSHVFWPARPENTVALQAAKGTGNTYGSTGNVNSCSASCHRGRVIVWTDIPANATPNDNKFGTANEVNLAKYLMQYFGPGGKWWDTKPPATK